MSPPMKTSGSLDCMVSALTSGKPQLLNFRGAKASLADKLNNNIWLGFFCGTAIVWITFWIVQSRAKCRYDKVNFNLGDLVLAQLPNAIVVLLISHQLDSGDSTIFNNHLFRSLQKIPISKRLSLRANYDNYYKLIDQDICSN